MPRHQEQVEQALVVEQQVEVEAGQEQALAEQALVVEQVEQALAWVEAVVSPPTS